MAEIFIYVQKYFPDSNFKIKTLEIEPVNALPQRKIFRACNL